MLKAGALSALFFAYCWHLVPGMEKGLNIYICRQIEAKMDHKSSVVGNWILMLSL